MTNTVVTIDAGHLHVEIRWDAPSLVGDRSPTLGALYMEVAGEPIWGESPDQGIEWDWAELLEWLGRSWPFLLWEEGVPFELAPARPADLEALASSRWDAMPRGERLEDEQALFAWIGVHDLSRAVNGLHLPRVLIYRQGTRFHVLTDYARTEVGAAELKAFLLGVGEAIRERMPDAMNPRLREAVEAWQRKDAQSTIDLTVLYTGLDENYLWQLTGSRTLADYWEIDQQADFEPTEILAAARMLAQVATSEDMEQILEQIRSVPAHRLADLDALSASWRNHSRSLPQGQEPYEEGYALASWLRERCGLAPEAKSDPRAWLHEFGVPVRNLEGPTWLDALACWGPRHGPAVLLNPGSERHESNPVTTRISLAHEIAHLIADRDGYLPLTEVLIGRAMPLVEKRARAFAAEFVLPREIARARFMDCEGPADVDRVLFALARDFEVSYAVVAWQVRNAPERPRKHVLDALVKRVSHQERYYPRNMPGF